MLCGVVVKLWTDGKSANRDLLKVYTEWRTDTQAQNDKMQQLLLAQSEKYAALLSQAAAVAEALNKRGRT